MKSIGRGCWIVLLLVLALPSRNNAQTDGTATFNVTTVSTGQSYDPKNIMAIWVVDNSGTFVKTLKKRAATRQQYLYKWIADSGQNTTDAITGATLSSHQAHTVTWNARNAAGTLVPDGTYRIRVEYTTRNGQGPYSTNWCQFVKGPAAASVNYPNLTLAAGGLRSMSLTWAPLAPTVHDVAVTGVSPTSGVASTIIPITVAVRNAGTAAEANVPVALSNQTDHVLIGQSTIASLAVGATANVVFNWNTTGKAGGVYALRGAAGPVTGETQAGDNAGSIAFTLLNAVHDLRVSNLQCPAVSPPGTTQNVTLTAMNIGTLAESFSVSVNDLTDGVTVGTRAVNTLPASASTNLTFRWNTAGRSEGRHTLAAVAGPVAGETSRLDNSNSVNTLVAFGLSTNVLIATNAVWRYSDQGLNLHEGPWTAESYYDGTWGAGPAQFGYGDGDEATVLGYGGVASNKYPTYYFRTFFVLDTIPVSASLRVLRDDGVALYLNEAEILRDNLAAGEPTAYLQWALTNIGGTNGTTFFAYPMGTSAFRIGRNRLAAELHQASPASGDASFALELRAVLPIFTKRHDVAIVSAEAPSSVLAGDKVRFFATVRNTGSAAESFSVTLTDTNTATLLGTRAIPTLAPGESTIADFEWNTLGVAIGARALRIAAPPVAGETNLADNALILPLAIQGDGFGLKSAPAVGMIGGACRAVAIVGSALYAGEGSALSCISLDDPSHPRLLGRLQLPGAIQSLAVSGTHVFAACGSAGVYFVDAGEPSSMNVRRSFESSGEAYALAVSGSRLYLADGVSGLRVLEVSDPAHPSLLGSYATEGPARAVAVAGEVACVADAFSGLLAISVANPAAPALLGRCDLVSSADSVVFNGTHAFSVDGEGYLCAINLANPAAPVLSGRVFLPAPGRGLCWGGDSRLLIAAGEGGLLTYDVSTPAAPAAGGTAATRGPAAAVAASGALAAVAATFGGVELFDIDTPSAPALLGALREGARVRDSVATNGHLFVAAGAEGMKVYSITNAAAPQLVAVCTNALNARAIALSGSLAFVADGQYGVEICNVASPEAPVHLGRYAHAQLGSVRSVAVAPAGLFACDGHRVHRIRVSTPSAPSLQSSYESSSYVQDIAVAGSTLVLAAGTGGLIQLDIAADGSLPERGRLEGGLVAVGVDVLDGKAYVADAAGGIRVVDLASGSPVVMSTLSGHAPGRGVARSGRKLFFADGATHLHVANAINPLTPIPEAVFGPLSRIMSVGAQGPYAVAALDESGAALVNASPGDGDVDGMDDAYEMAIVNAKSDDAVRSIEDVQPEADFDHDGLSNYAEWVAGTSPTAGESVFALQSGSVQPGERFVIRWHSAAGRTYSVYHSTNLVQGFSLLKSSIPADPPLNSYTDTVVTAGSFYMIKVQ